MCLSKCLLLLLLHCMFYFYNLSTGFPGPKGIVLLLGFVVRYCRRVNCFSFRIEQIWICFCFQVPCLLSSCDVIWDSFKKNNYYQGGKCQNPLSVLSSVLINVITSLHILDTVIFCFEYKPQKCSQILTPMFYSEDWRVFCSVVFSFSPPDNYTTNKLRGTDDSQTESPDCMVSHPPALSFLFHQNSFAFPFDSHKSTFRILQTLQCIKHYSRWCFLTMPFYMK